MSRQMEGTIYKALSGFYYVKVGAKTVECKARGRFRREKISPLVGDRVVIRETEDGKGVIDEICPRRNMFIRPPVANIERMVIVASEAIPVTDPYLIDRVAAIAEHNNCEPVICINKCDTAPGLRLYDIYKAAGFLTIRTSAVTGEGIEDLSDAIAGRLCAFTGNSGVGKSSILNALEPDFDLQVGDVSQKLGRGRHTTRHVELFSLKNGALIADTPGFSSFDTERMELVLKDDLQYCFREFADCIGKCRYTNCAHIKEDGCAVLEALNRGEIQPSRHESYKRLYEQLKQLREWELR